MSFRWITASIVAVSVVALAAVVYGVSRALIDDGFGSVEDSNARSDLQRARNALDEEIAGVDENVVDWSSWDDTYAFMETRDSAYLDSNITDFTFSSIDLSAILILDRGGATVVSAGPGAAKTADALIVAAGLPPEGSPDTEAFTRSGVVVVDGMPVMFAARPVLTSENGGPARGFVIMARDLDEAHIAALAERTRLDLQILVADTADPPLGADEDERLDAISDSRLLARATYPAGNETLTLRIELPRSVAEKGRDVALGVTLALVGAALLAGLASFALLDRFVLRRMKALGASVRSIAASEDASRRVPDPGGRELGTLADDVNGMLESLERAENRYRLLIATAMDGILTTVGESATVATANPAAEKLFGYEPGTLKGVELPRLRDVVPARQVVIEMARKSGEAIWVDATASLSGEGAEQRKTVMLRDITERRRAVDGITKLYAESEAAKGEARAILDAVKEGILVISAEGNVLSTNRQFSEMFGLPPSEMAHRPSNELVPQVRRIFADPEAFLSRVAGTAFDAETDFREIFWQRDPADRELELFSTPVKAASGLHLGRLYVFRDVTEERAVDRMKSEFVSLVSHELRTPLTSIKGYVDLLLEGEAGGLEPVQSEFLGTVKSNADRLMVLINDLLDVSRIEAGRIELRRSAVDVAAVIRHVASTLRPQIEARQQVLALDLPPHVPAADADRDRVAQIVLNLVSNAHKYTDRGGRIGVTLSSAGGMVTVAVSDTGIGLSEDEQSRLFTRFWRANNRATQEAAGTGLGLAIVRSLVELHGGTITVTSAPGQGSTFEVSLPTAAASQESGSAPGPASSAILIVEDDRDNASLFRLYAERAGFVATTVGTGRGALQRIRESAPALILLDLLLPDLDGIALLDEIKDEPETTEIPVVVVSMADSALDARAHGAAAVLRKPVDEQELIEAVRAALAQKAGVGVAK